MDGSIIAHYAKEVMKNDKLIQVEMELMSYLLH